LAPKSPRSRRDWGKNEQEWSKPQWINFCLQVAERSSFAVEAHELHLVDRHVIVGEVLTLIPATAIGKSRSWIA